VLYPLPRFCRHRSMQKIWLFAGMASLVPQAGAVTCNRDTNFYSADDCSWLSSCAAANSCCILRQSSSAQWLPPGWTCYCHYESRCQEGQNCCGDECCDNQCCGGQCCNGQCMTETQTCCPSEQVCGQICLPTSDTADGCQTYDEIPDGCYDGSELARTLSGHTDIDSAPLRISSGDSMVWKVFESVAGPSSSCTCDFKYECSLSYPSSGVISTSECSVTSTGTTQCECYIGNTQPDFGSFSWGVAASGDLILQSGTSAAFTLPSIAESTCTNADVHHPSGKSGTSTGAVVGIALAGVAGAAILLFCLCRSKKTEGLAGTEMSPALK